MAGMCSFATPNQPLDMHQERLESQILHREVIIEVVLPKGYQHSHQPCKLLVINDGQDAAAFHLKEVMADWDQSHPQVPMVALAIHVGERKQEYGLTGKPDFAKRGTRAGDYARFIETELFPWALKKYRISEKTADRAIAGFSLGALSAFDLAWNLPQCFGNAALFSGSFWWRAKDLDESYKPGDRLVLQVIEESIEKKDIRFWFQTGWHDESADRDKDGLIDSIGDTLDVILALENRGYQPGKDIEYVELGSGHHDHKTMARIFPQFLKWWLANETALAV